MRYLKIELLKINKAVESKISYLFIFIMVLTIGLGFRSTQNSPMSNVDLIFATIGNFSRYIIFQIVLILMTSHVIANEFKDGTYRYIMIRPVSIKSLLMNKYLALWIFAGQILLFTTI